MVLESPIGADIALIKAHRADGAGNLTYRRTARNFGPVMATAARRTVVQVSEVVPTGEIDPESVVTPGIYVDTVVRLDSTTTIAGIRPDHAPKEAVS
jgi:3-oxoadipate CoA-transferase, alpha subunit